MPHCQYVGLAGTAGAWNHRKVDLVCTGLDCTLVLEDGNTCSLVGVEDDGLVGAEDLSCPPDGLVDILGGGSAGSILEAEGIKGDVCIQDLAENLLVEIGVVGSGPVAVWKAHHCDGDLVLQTGVVDGLSAVDEVVNIIESIEVSDCGHAVLLEKLCMKGDDVSRLAVQTYNIDASGECLKVCIRAGNSSEFVHHCECIFICVEVERLETGTATCFEVGNAGFSCCLDGRHEILCENACAINGLETVAEGGAHEIDLFLGHVLILLFFCLFVSCCNCDGYFTVLCACTWCSCSPGLSRCFLCHWLRCRRNL